MALASRGAMVGKGVCAGSLPALEPSALAEALDDLRALGAGWVRFDFDWNAFQTHGAADFASVRFDRVVDGCVDRGIGVLGVIAYRALWARPAGLDQFHPPQDPADFGLFAGRLANRYRGRVAAWEIWNEANLGGVFWKPRADPAAYTALLKAAYPEIKAKDPAATVVACGTAPAADDGIGVGWLRWYRSLYLNGAGPFFDAAATHPYTRDLPSSRDGSGYWWDQSRLVHAVMAANGDGAKTVWMTEFGRATGGPEGASEALQADIIRDAYRLHAGLAWAGPLFVYEYQDSGTSRETSENFFGLRRADGSPKPAYAAFRENPVGGPPAASASTPR